MVLMVNCAECCSVEKRVDKQMVYLLVVQWQNQPKTTITRTILDFIDFSSSLKSATKGMKGVTVPTLPGLKWFQRFGNADEKRKTQVNEFCKEVIKLANAVTSPDVEAEVVRFFNEWIIDLDASARNPPKAEKGKNKGKEKEKEKDKKKDKKEKEEKLKKQGGSKKKKNDDEDPQIKELQEVFRQHSVETSTDPDPNNQFIVTTDFLQPEEGQVTLHASEIVEVMERTVSGWWYVYCEEEQKEGWAPASLLEPLDPYAPNDVQPEAVAACGGKFRALADYTANKDDELSYKKDQVLDVISMSLDGWWTAKLNGKTGLVSAPNLTQVKDESRDSADAIPLYETFSVFQQHSIYRKKPPPRRDPDLCLSELYAKVDVTQKIKRGPKPEPLSPKPKLSKEDDELYVGPELPRRNVQMRYTEIVFDDDKPGKPRSVIIGGDDRTLYSEIVLDDPPRPRTPQKQERTRVPNVVPPEPKPTSSPTLGFYEAIEDYAPISTQKDSLALKKGDIIAVQKELVELFFCELCEKETNKGDSCRPCEGWVPKKVVRQIKCDILREENGVKIVRLVQPVPAQRAPKEKGPGTPQPSAKEAPILPLKAPPAAKIAAHENGQSSPQASGQPPALPQPATGARGGSGEFAKYKWFAGSMDRPTCNEHMAGAREGQFLIRESKGEFSLSVAAAEKIRHFQIKHTESGQYTIGGHNFNDLKSIVKNYKRQPLYYADKENKDGRCLGEPFLPVNRIT